MLLAPQLGLRLIRSQIGVHQLHGGIRYGIAAATSTASAECMYLLVIECGLWPNRDAWTAR